MEPVPVLELNDAVVVKGGQRILDGVTLSIREGEHTAIVGPNGSGKSSLIKLLTHQHYPLVHADGSPPVRVFGQHRWNIADLRSQLGIVSPDLQHSFVTGSSVGKVRGLEAVVSGFLASHVIFLHHDVTDAMRAEAARALELVGAEHLAEKRLDQMSTGEARRVLIARALVTDPRMLVLDEPTTGLDLVARQSFLARIRRIAQGGVTVLLITHHVEEIFPEVSRVILLRRGRVAYDGPKREVLDAGPLGEVFESPVSVHERGGWYRLGLDSEPGR